MFKSLSTATAALFLLAGCGGGGTLAHAQIPSAMRTASGACPQAPTPGSVVPATISIVLPTGQSLLVGQPADYTVTFYGFDAYGSYINGNFKLPATMRLSSAFPGAPRITLSCSTVYSSGQTATLIYDGKADIVKLTGTVNGKPLQKPGTLATLLPNPTKVRGGSVGETIQFDPNGNLWSEGKAKRSNVQVALARIDQSLDVKTFVDPNSNHWLSGDAFVDRSGGVWVGYYDDERIGLERYDPKGKRFSKYPLPKSMISAGSVSGIAQDKSGAIWISTVSADVGRGYYIAIVRGQTLKPVATLSDPPYNLTADPQGRGMWFSAGTQLYHVRGDGSLKSIAIATVSSSGIVNPAHFTLGPDGNWWVPYPFEKSILVKVSLNCSVVSRKAIPYFGGSFLEVNGSFVRDSSGNLFETDPDGDGLIRFTPSGEVTELRSQDMNQNAIEYLTAAKDGTLYLLVDGGITKLDPHLW